MKNKMKIFEQIKGQLIVSCQALPEEPMHSSFIMSKMAFSAMLGGAKGIRANSVEDIRAIKSKVKLPIIGIIKAVYDNSDVYITPTRKEVDLLVEEGVEIIAMDATKRIRPDGKVVSEVFPEIRQQYKEQIFMADCSTYEEAVEAYKLGFDCIGTTLSGYTSYTEGVELPNIALLKQLVTDLPVPIIAEGGIWSPEQLKDCMNAGIYAAVIGTAITRPMDITKRFIRAIES